MSKLYCVFEDNRKWAESASIRCDSCIDIPDEVMDRKVYRSKDDADNALKEIVEKFGKRRDFYVGELEFME